MCDTNIVVSALVFGRRLAWLREYWRQGAIVPLICAETKIELLRVLGYQKFRLNAAERDALLGDYLPFAETVRLPSGRAKLAPSCRDLDDIIFIELALAARADLLVSGDAHLVDLRDSLPVKVVTSSELAAIAGADQARAR